MSCIFFALKRDELIRRAKTPGSEERGGRMRAEEPPERRLIKVEVHKSCTLLYQD
jgi:hypothetical protein